MVGGCAVVFAAGGEEDKGAGGVSVGGSGKGGEEGDDVGEVREVVLDIFCCYCWWTCE